MLRRYGKSIGAVAVGLLVALWAQPVLDPTTVFLAAVIVAAWFGGRDPGLLAAVLALLAVEYFFTPPFHSLEPRIQQVPRLMVFAALAVLSAWGSAARKRAEDSLREARDELDVRVLERTAELTRANERLAMQYDDLRRQASLLDLTHDTVIVRDMTGVITFWNRGAEEQYGWTRAEAHGRVTHDLLQTVFPAPLADIDAEVARNGRWNGELIQTRRDGTKVVVASRWALQLDAHAHPVAVLETNNDITERKRAEAELRESERRHRHIFQTTAVSIWEEDFSRVKAAIDGLKASGVRNFREYLRTSPQFVRDAISLVRVVDVNEATLALFGAKSRDELVVSLHRVFTPQADEIFAEELLTIAEGRSSFEGETVLQTIEGTRIAVLFSVSFPPQDSAFDSVLVSIIDITDRKRAEQALEELAGRLIHAQEEERSRIGRELHDHISQTLGVLTIRIDQLRADPALPPAVAGALGDLRQGTVDITDDVHRLSHRLHSSTLDYLGLVPALQKLVKEFAQRHGIAIDFAHAALPAPLPTEVALCLFRVTEEALTNIAKHSSARSAHVRITGEADGIHLSVEDTGAGFDMARLEKGAGLGFVSMQERLRVLRGTVRVDSAPARGTRVEAWIPAASVQMTVASAP